MVREEVKLECIKLAIQNNMGRPQKKEEIIETAEAMYAFVSAPASK